MTTADQYEAQYDAVSAQQAELQAEYTHSLDSLDEQNSSVAMVTIMASTLILVIYFIESEEMDSTITLNALSQMETDEQSMQADFDDVNTLTEEYNDGDFGPTTTQAYDAYNAAVEDDINDAWGYAQDIEEICALPQFSSIAGDAGKQIESIFNTDYAYTTSDETTTDSLNLQDTATQWEESWGFEPDMDKDTIIGGYVNTTSDSMASDQQVYTNAFSALSTDFSNMSSSTQSELQYYESEDQQMQGLDETLMQEWAQEEQTMINNQITT